MMFCETTQRLLLGYIEINLQYKPAGGLCVTTSPIRT